MLPLPMLLPTIRAGAACRHSAVVAPAAYASVIAAALPRAQLRVSAPR